MTLMGSRSCIIVFLQVLLLIEFCDTDDYLQQIVISGLSGFVANNYTQVKTVLNL